MLTHTHTHSLNYNSEYGGQSTWPGPLGRGERADARTERRRSVRVRARHGRLDEHVLRTRGRCSVARATRTAPALRPSRPWSSSSKPPATTCEGRGARADASSCGADGSQAAWRKAAAQRTKNSRSTASPPPCSSTSSDEHGGEAATSCTSSVGAIAARAARDGVDDVQQSRAAAAWPACSPVDLVHWRHVASKYFGLCNQLFDFGCFGRPGIELDLTWLGGS